MGSPEDDDPATEWFAARTEVDGPRLPVPGVARDPVTAPHPIAGDVATAFENGRQAGIAEGIRIGQRDAEEALVRIMTRFFGDGDESIRHLMAAWRKEMTPV